MSSILRILFPLIGYVSVATVLTLAFGFGYLRSSGKLGDEQMFRIVALLHGVDMEKISAEIQPSSEEVPAEETSYAELQAHRQIAMRGFEAKQEDLDRDLEGFNYQLRRVNDATIRYAALRRDVESYLNEQYQRINQEGPMSVRQQLEKLDPKKQAKPLLLQWVEEGRMEDVILMLNGMKARNREAILKTFTSEKELATLHDIQNHMMSGEPIKPKIDNAVETLNQLNEQGK